MRKETQKWLLEMSLAPDDEIDPRQLEFLNAAGVEFPSYREIVVSNLLGSKYLKNYRGPDFLYLGKYVSEAKGRGVWPSMQDAEHPKTLKGGGNISDHTWERHYKMIQDSVLMVDNGFVGKRPIFAVGFLYADLGFVEVIEKKFETAYKDTPDKKRSIAWSGTNYQSICNLKVLYKAPNFIEYYDYMTRPLANFLLSREVDAFTEEELSGCKLTEKPEKEMTIMDLIDAGVA